MRLGTYNVKMQEGRKLAVFLSPLYDNLKDRGTWDSKTNKMIGQVEFDRYQGWLNSATYTFNLYFMQEENLQNRLRRLRRQDGKINYDKATKLFHEAQCLRLMEQIDDDCEGPVDVKEIVDNFLDDQKEQA
jgi:hypothetical protein